MLKVFLSGLPWLALCATTALPPRTLAAPSPLPPEPGTRTNSLAQAISDPEPAQPAQQITVRVLTPTHQGSGTLLGKQGNRYLVLATLANYHQSKTGNIVEVPKGNAAPEIWIQQGNPLRQLGRHPEAIIALQESTRRQPNYTPALGSLAASQREVQQALEALAAINKAIQQQPNNADLYNEKFLILRNLERHQEALAAINQALKRSEQAGFYYNRGLTYNALKQYPQALADYNKAIALNPKDAEAYFNRGLTYFYDLKQYPQALADYTKAIALNPKYAEAYGNRGNTYALMGNTAQAKQDLQTAAQLFQQQNRPEDYQKAIQLLQQL